MQLYTVNKTSSELWSKVQLSHLLPGKYARNYIAEYIGVCAYAAEYVILFQVSKKSKMAFLELYLCSRVPQLNHPSSDWNINP